MPGANTAILWEFIKNDASATEFVYLNRENKIIKMSEVRCLGGFQVVKSDSAVLWMVYINKVPSSSGKPQNK